MSKVLDRIIRTSLYNPDWFCENILNSLNDDWQSELLNAVADIDRLKAGKPTKFNHEGLTRFSVRSCHGPGKTHTAAKLMHWWNFTRRGLIPCTAPKANQVVTRLWPAFRKILSSADEDYQSIIHVDTKKITWLDNRDHTALVESGASAENLQGLHDDDLLFIVDEASGVNEDMFPAIEGSLSTESAVLFMIGNPTKTSGEFYNSHKKRGTKELYYRMHISYKDSPRVSKKWALNMIKKYGKKSPVVLTRVYGEFSEQSENQLYTIASIEEAKINKAPNTGEKPKVRVAIDVADGGEDETVVTVGFIYQNHIIAKRQKSFSFPSGRSPLMAAEAGERMFYAFGGVKGVDDFVVDGIGVGAGTVGTLMERGHKVVNFKAGTDSTDKTKWKNVKAQTFFTARDGFRDNWIYIDDEFVDTETEWDDFLAQMCSIQTKPGNERQDELVSKLQLKSQGIKSPDRADSMTMLLAPHVQEVEAW